MTFPAVAPSEARLRTVPWEALAGLGPALEAPLAAVLAGEPAERVIDRALRAWKLPGPSRAAIAEAIFGVGLWRRRLRAALGDPAAPPRLLLAALVAHLGGRGEAEAAALAALPPGALPPGLATRPPPAALADRFSLPDWLATAIEVAAPGEAAALADALCTPGPIALRPNRLAATPAGLAQRLAAEGVRTLPGRLAPGALRVDPDGPRPNLLGTGAWRDGWFEVQDEASQLAGAAVEAAPGEVMLDACAGAGGKALLLAAAVGPAGEVHAADADAARLARLGVRARAAGADRIVHVHGETAPKGLRVDAALVDAPCSELGALRRGPDLRWRLDPAGFAALPTLQLEILRLAAGHVRPGGRLVYATCTFRREEDEDVALAFEATHPGFRRVPVAAPAAARTPDGFLRTFPHRHGTDGFFAAAWRRAPAPGV